MAEDPTIYHVRYGDSHGLHLLVEPLPNVPLRGLGDLVRWSFRLKGRPRLIVIDTFAKWGMLGWLASYLWQTPLVLWVNAEFFKEQSEVYVASRGAKAWLRYRWRRLTGWLVSRRVCRVLPNSEHIRFSESFWIGDRGGPTVHPPYREAHASDAEPATPFPSGKLHLLTVMHLQFSSKVEPTLEALREWLPPAAWDELDIQWLICGDGPQLPRLRYQIAKLGLQDRVHAPGHVAAMPAAYRWCHALVHLTRLDAFPRVTMEAHMAGKPVITNADSCGTREQVTDGTHGRVVDDPETFLAALRDYAEHPEHAREHGEQGRRQVSDFFLVKHQQQRMADALRTIARECGEARRVI